MIPRQIAFALAASERGLLEQAIAFWHRVEKAWPGDEKVKQSISMLVVERAWSLGDLKPTDAISQKLRLQAQQEEKASLESRLLESMKQEPEKLDHYLELSQVYLNEQRYGECEALLARAYEMSGRDADVREKWEDAQLRHLRQQIAQAADPDVEKQLRAEYFRKDLEAYQNRVRRYPSNLLFRYEFGHRLLLAKQYAEAIAELQIAKKEPQRKGLALLALGQCFQQIPPVPSGNEPLRIGHQGDSRPRRGEQEAGPLHGRPLGDGRQGPRHGRKAFDGPGGLGLQLSGCLEDVGADRQVAPGSGIGPYPKR